MQSNRRYSSSNHQPLQQSPKSNLSQNQQDQDSYSSGTFDMGKYKTKLCRHWKTGYCLFGPSCVFAHGVDDLCEPNLLTVQMNNLVLVPVQAYPMPVYPSDSNGVPSQLSSGSQLTPIGMPMMSYGGSSGLAPPTFAYQGSTPPTPGATSALAFGFTPELLPTSNNFSLGGMSYYNQGRNERPNYMCGICMTSFDNSKDKAFLPCMHEFHGQCIQRAEKTILQNGCPLCFGMQPNANISLANQTQTLPPIQIESSQSKPTSQSPQYKHRSSSYKMKQPVEVTAE